MKYIILAFKAWRKIYQNLFAFVYTPYAKLLLKLNGVEYKDGLCVKGFITVHVTRRGNVKLGSNFRINSGNNFNIIGRQQKTIFWVEGELIIGDNVGVSGSAFICKDRITIGNNVLIGGNTVIYDTDFHSLDASIRSDKLLDLKSHLSSPVEIEDDAFIGAHCTILKGVHIGRGSVIGACSVVAKNVPANQVWAGNPLRYIRSL
jgi:acetyltransferase-like isoleucine patch superfamily enzyme